MLDRNLKMGLAVGLIALAGELTSCGNSGECNSPHWTNQCAEASALWAAFPDYFRTSVGIELESSVDAGTAPNSQLRCPTLRELQYELINPYVFDLQGQAFISEPASGTSGGLCCYTTTYYCE